MESEIISSAKNGMYELQDSKKQNIILGFALGRSPSVAMIYWFCKFSGRMSRSKLSDGYILQKKRAANKRLKSEIIGGDSFGLAWAVLSAL